jgi:hypothetical protein
MGELLKLSKTINKDAYWSKIYPEVVTKIGYSAHMILNRLVYWSSYYDKQNTGWFYMSAEEIYSQTRVMPRTQRTCINLLKHLGLLQDYYDRRNHRKYFKVNMKNYDNFLVVTTGKNFRNHRQIEPLAPANRAAGTGNDCRSSYKTVEESSRRTKVEDRQTDRVDREDFMDTIKTLGDRKGSDIDPAKLNAVAKIVKSWIELQLQYPNLKKESLLACSKLEEGKDLKSLNPVYSYIYDFVDNHEDWEEQWVQVTESIHSSSWLQNGNERWRLKLLWIFSPGSVPGISNKVKHAGLCQIISGKYDGGVKEKLFFLDPKNKDDKGVLTPEAVRKLEEIAKKQGKPEQEIFIIK